MAIAALGDIAKMQLGMEHFEAVGIYEELERICKSTRSSTIFQSCLKFIECLIGSNEQLASSSPKIVAFVDIAMQRVVHNLRSVSIHRVIRLMTDCILPI
jgi:hypothetical protein